MTAALTLITTALLAVRDWLAHTWYALWAWTSGHLGWCSC